LLDHYLADLNASLKTDSPFKNQIVFAGDTGQEVFSFGFFFPGHPQTCHQFHPLVYIKGNACGTDVVFSKYAKEVIDLINAWLANNPSVTAFLGGDWEFINSIQGIMGCQATYGCPICKRKMTNCLYNNDKSVIPAGQQRLSQDELKMRHIHDRVEIVRTGQPRRNLIECQSAMRANVAMRGFSENNAQIEQRNFSQIRLPLFPSIYENVIPTPLHVALGLGNHFLSCLKETIEENKDTTGILALDDRMKQIKQQPKNIHGSRPLGAMNDLNGGELQKLFAEDSQQHQSFLLSLLRFIPPETRFNQARAELPRMYEIASYIIYHLSSMDPFNALEIDNFKSIAVSALHNWHRTNKLATKQRGKLKPKVHMLFHCYEFIDEHKYIGPYSESAMESHHSNFNSQWEINSNCGRDVMMKLYRSAKQVGVQRSVDVNKRRSTYMKKPKKRKKGKYAAARTPASEDVEDHNSQMENESN
jgi:hypothetical protein